LSSPPFAFFPPWFSLFISNFPFFFAVLDVAPVEFDLCDFPPFSIFRQLGRPMTYFDHFPTFWGLLDPFFSIPRLHPFSLSLPADRFPFFRRS